MTTRGKFDVVFGVIAIAALWAMLAFFAMLLALGDCFEPGCGDWKQGYVKTAPVILGVGFVAHAAAFVWRRIRRARED